MERTRRWAGAGVLVALLGALTTMLPRLDVSSQLGQCVDSSGWPAHVAVRLRLLAPSLVCPEGTLAPGAHYAEIAQLSVLLSLTALVLAAFALLTALGIGVWAHGALRAARAWIRDRLVIAVPAPLTIALAGPLPVAVAGPPPGSAFVQLPRRRGPPLPAPA